MQSVLKRFFLLLRHVAVMFTFIDGLKQLPRLQDCVLQTRNSAFESQLTLVKAFPRPIAFSEVEEVSDLKQTAAQNIPRS